MSNFEELLDLIDGKDVKDILRGKIKKDVSKNNDSDESVESVGKGILESSEKDVGKGKVKRKRDKRLKGNKSKPKSSIYMKDKLKYAKRENVSRDALLRKYRAGEISEKELGTLKHVLDFDLIDGDKKLADKTPKKVFSKGKGEQVLKILNRGLEARERDNNYGFGLVEVVDGFDRIKVDGGICEIGLNGDDTFKAKVRRPLLVERGGKIYKVFTATKLTDSFLARNMTLNYLSVFNDVDGVIFIQNKGYSYKSQYQLRSAREKSKRSEKNAGSLKNGLSGLKKNKIGSYNREREIQIINEKREKERKEHALQVLLDNMNSDNPDSSDKNLTVDDINVDVDDYDIHIVSGKSVYQYLYDRLYNRLLKKGTLNNQATVHISRKFPKENGVLIGTIFNAILEN